MKRIVLFSLVMAGIFLLLFSCAATSGSTGSSGSTPDIEILGSWTVTNIDINTGYSPGANSITFVVSNSSYATVYHPALGTAAGTILTYNNDQNYFVVYVTSDSLYPTSVPYYEKIGWEFTTPSNLIISAFDIGSNQAHAETITNIIWGPVSNCLKQ